jgi:hypothetical protein
LEARELDSFPVVVARNETWFVLECYHSTKWGVVRDEVPMRVGQMIKMRKVLSTVIWEIDGFHTVDMMPSRGLFNIEYFYAHVMHLLLAKVLPEGRKAMHFD